MALPLLGWVAERAEGVVLAAQHAVDRCHALFREEEEAVVEQSHRADK